MGAFSAEVDAGSAQENATNVQTTWSIFRRSGRRFGARKCDKRTNYGAFR
jgi:hypothetical protein